MGVAFALGGSARSIPLGLVHGSLGLMAAVGVYYLLFAILDDGIRSIGAGHAATTWGAVALVIGPFMGTAGAAWRRADGWPRAIAVACLAAALIAEGLAFRGPRLMAFDPVTDPGSLLFGAEIILGFALPMLLLPPDERARSYLVVFVMAVLAAVAIGPLVRMVRDLADRF